MLETAQTIRDSRHGVHDQQLSVVIALTILQCFVHLCLSWLLARMQAEAVQRALTNLYSRNFLPANPFPLLADVLSGSLDQDGVWRLTDQQASLS